MTFVSMLAPSLMGKLGIPFVIGPIAGGERTPYRLRHSMPFRGKVTEMLRDVMMVLQRYNPLVQEICPCGGRPNLCDRHRQHETCASKMARED